MKKELTGSCCFFSLPDNQLSEVVKASFQLANRVEEDLIPSTGFKSVDSSLLLSCSSDEDSCGFVVSGNTNRGQEPRTPAVPTFSVSSPSPIRSGPGSPYD